MADIQYLTGDEYGTKWLPSLTALFTWKMAEFDDVGLLRGLMGT